MENQEIYKDIAGRFTAWQNCRKSDNSNPNKAEWEGRHYNKIIDSLNLLPHGSGLDGQWMLNFETSQSEKLVFNMEYHAMNDAGYYDGWLPFTLTVTPSLQFGINLAISGRFGKYQDVKDYLYDILR